MGMHHYVLAFAPPDDTWRRMKAAWDACKAAGAPVPREVERFFNDEEPDEAGVEIKITAPVIVPYNAEMRDGHEVDLEALKKAYPQVKRLRFVCSY